MTGYHQQEMIDFVEKEIQFSGENVVKYLVKM